MDEQLSPERAALAARRSSGTTQFSDASGMRWTVWEIAYPVFSERLLSLFPHPERRAGWLLFESQAEERRRLSPFPAEWRGFSDLQLADLCAHAVPAAKGQTRRREDAP